MKLPKTLQICGKTYKITTNNKVGGAWFSCNKQMIELGTRDSKERQLASLIHEIMEIVMVEREYRFQTSVLEPENGDYMFVFCHKGYEIIAEDVANVIRQIYGN